MNEFSYDFMCFLPIKLNNITLVLTPSPLVRFQNANFFSLSPVPSQNVHLVKNWLPTLDKKMEKSFENPHPNYRLFISAEPSPDPEFHVVPQVS